MSELILAVLIFVLSQFILKLIIEPYIEFKKSRNEISYQILLNQSNILSSPDANTELANTFNHLSANLRAALNSILGYKLLRLLSFNKLPSKTEVKKASQELNRISYELSSNSKEHIEIHESLKQIAQKLKIETFFSTRSQY